MCPPTPSAPVEGRPEKKNNEHIHSCVTIMKQKTNEKLKIKVWKETAFFL